MRPLESLLLLANLLAFFAVVVPLPDARRWTRRFAATALLIAPAQWLVEGPRWQMAPAYLLAGLFFLWLWPHRPSPARPPSSTWTKGLAVGVATALGALVLAVSIALPIAVPVFRFPNPSGPYEIGTLTYHWVDSGRREFFNADPNARRELMVQLWYPAKPNPSARRAPYVPDARVLAPLAGLLRLPAFIFGHLSYVTTNAVESAPIANGEPSYPVLIFSPGRSGFRQHNTLQVEALVSHGYIVAAIDHPYAASGVVFPDGRLVPLDARMLDRGFINGVIPYLAHDAVFTLDQLTALNRADPNGILTGRMDLRRVGMFGLSLGGAVTAETCRLESRVRACLVMDVFMPADVVLTGLQQPTMGITRDAVTMQLEGWSKQDIDETLTTMRAVFESLPGDGYFLRVPGMFHQDFADAALLSPLTSWAGLTGPINGQRAHDIVSAYSLAFFDRHLKGRPAALLDGPSKQYPEVLFETRRGWRTGG
ncbi:MAG: carboxylic ester hydrolase [Acidobacteriota bacterium]